MKFIKKLPKNITKRECSLPNKFTIDTSYKFIIWNICLDPKICNTKGLSEKLQPIRKRPFQNIDKSTDVTYKLIDSNKKMFNIETLFCHITQKNTVFAS